MKMAEAAREHWREARRISRVLVLGFLQNPWAVDRTWRDRIAESSWFVKVVARAALAALPELAALAIFFGGLAGWLWGTCTWRWAALATCAYFVASRGSGRSKAHPLRTPASPTRRAASPSGTAAEGCSSGWTTEQAALVEWIAQQTYRLDPSQVDTVWGMGEESKQLGFTSRRYHLAFCFYATVAAFQHVPAYSAEARRILDWLLEQMLDFKSWSYARIYWPEQPDPFDCDENVMWLGHVLAMVTLYESLLGDDRFRRRISVRDDKGREFCSSTSALAERVARAYRGSPRGGMCCEPGLVFFACQNHALQGLHLESQLRGTAFDDILERWEGYATRSFGAAAGGALQLCEVSCLSAKLPTRIGHLGGDGWAVAYWAPWSPHLPGRVWYERVRPILDPVLPDILKPLEAEPAHGPTTCACLTLDIPRVPVVAFLFAAAAAVGDAATAGLLCAWLRAAARSREGAMWVPEGRDWSMTSTAQLLIGLSWTRGATLRSVPQISGGFQLQRAEHAHVLMAEPREDGLLLMVEPRAHDTAVVLHTNFCIRRVLQYAEGCSEAQACALPLVVKEDLCTIEGRIGLAVRLLVVPLEGPSAPGG